MADHRRPREFSRLPAQGWTVWFRAMVPLDDQGGNVEPRGDGQVGFICTNIRAAFSDEANRCGIYEWRVKGTLDHQPKYVVYVGSTCRGKAGALRRRIEEYCTNGSHKANLINGALQRGYELWVRVKTSNGREDAENMENELLERYNYAWNERKNGIRHILA